MDRVVDGFSSVVLKREMGIAVYGHYGPALLLFPPAGTDFQEFERMGIIDAIQPSLDAGRLKVFTISSIDSEAWANTAVPARTRAIRHQQFNRYVTEEVFPYIARSMRSSHPTIYTGGVEFGALHAVNTFLRRPDLFDGTIGVSGTYDLKTYTEGYYDDDVYFNSPVDYLPNLGGLALNSLRQKEKVVLLSGRGAGTNPDGSSMMGDIMGHKGIRNWVDLWSEDYAHNWDAWRAMLSTAVGRHF